MAVKDSFHNTDLAIALEGQTIDTDTTTNGAAVDRSDYQAVMFVVSIGPYTDGDYEIVLQEADDDGTGNPDTWSDVADADLLGSEATLSTDQFFKVGYRGVKKWLRVNVVSTNTTDGASVACVALLSRARYAPFTTQAVT